jgi:L-ascorbate metabolism protein UlaG (beta-lactamase superfamily)
MCLLCAAAVSREDVPDALFPSSLERFPWPDGGALGGTVTWTGVAGLVLEVRGVRVAFDPFVTRPGLFATLFRRARPDEASVAARFSALDAAFVGHTHYDHAMDLPAVARASPRATIHGSATTTEACRRLGVGERSLRTLRDGEAVEVGPFRVEAVRAAHGVVPLVRWFDRVDLPAEGMPRTPFRWPRGEVLAFRVEVGGRSLHVQGSAGIDDVALARQGPCEVLVACLAARKGTPRYLERLGERLRPGVLVPFHHDDFFRPLDEPPRPIPTLRTRALAREVERLASAHGTRLVALPRGRPVPL